MMDCCYLGPDAQGTDFQQINLPSYKIPRRCFKEIIPSVEVNLH